MARELREIGAIIFVAAAGYAALEYWRPNGDAVFPITDRIGLVASVFAVCFLAWYLAFSGYYPALSQKRLWLSVLYASGWTAALFAIPLLFVILSTITWLPRFDPTEPRAIPGIVTIVGGFVAARAYFWKQQSLAYAIGWGLVWAAGMGAYLYFAPLLK